MLSKVDWEEWLKEKKIWTAAAEEEEERKEMQAAFDCFHKSESWGMICMINEINDFFDIVIRIAREKRSYLSGTAWKKSYLTPEQLKSVQEKQQELEQEKKEVLPVEQSTKIYKWGITVYYSRWFGGTCGDGIVIAHSPEEAERMLRLEELRWNTEITVFY